MSTRCTIAMTGHFHFYSCCNSGWDVFLSENIKDWPLEGYNQDIRIGHKELRELYEKLKEYFEGGADYEKYWEKNNAQS